MVNRCVAGFLLLVLLVSWTEYAQAVEQGREIQRFQGHTNDVRSVTFSPDGRSVLTGSADNTARLWDTATGRELRRFEGHSEPVFGVAFSPDGRSVLTGSADKTARLWSTEAGREFRRFEGHADWLRSVAFSPDGRSVLTGSSDTTTRLWDTATGRGLRLFDGHTNYVHVVAFSPDGRSVLTGSADNTARLWDTATGRELHRFKGHGASVYGVAFSPDGGSVLTGSTDRTARLWDKTTGRELRRFEGHSSYVNVVAFSPDGRLVLTGSADNTARLWDTATGRELRRFEGHSSAVFDAAFSPDGRLVLTGSADKTARLWETGIVVEPALTASAPPLPQPEVINFLSTASVVQPIIPPLPPSDSFTGPRHALVIAAKSYRNITPLERTITDARALAKALDGLGFTVAPLVENPDRRTLMLAVARFADELRKNPNALAFVLFSGHGVAIDGVNYLLPVDFPAIGDLPASQGAALIRADALALDALLEPLKEAGTRHLVALLDACRDNPLVGSGSKSVGGTRGLARIRGESGSYVMFTAGAGEKALDKLPGADPSPYGLFMRHFLTSLKNPHWPLDKMFKETAKLAQRDARGVDHRQNPEIFTQDYDDIILGSPTKR